MSLDCQSVRERLADGELRDALDRDALDRNALDRDALDRDAHDLAEHLDGCDACRAIAAALVDVDADLDALPAHDASDALVLATLARVAEEGKKEQAAPIGGGTLLFASLATLVAALGSLLWAPFAALLALPKTPRPRLFAGLATAMVLGLAFVGTAVLTLQTAQEAPGPLAQGDFYLPEPATLAYLEEPAEEETRRREEGRYRGDDGWSIADESTIFAEGSRPPREPASPESGYFLPGSAEATGEEFSAEGLEQLEALGYAGRRDIGGRGPARLPAADEPEPAFHRGLGFDDTEIERDGDGVPDGVDAIAEEAIGLDEDLRVIDERQSAIDEDQTVVGERNAEGDSVALRQQAAEAPADEAAARGEREGRLRGGEDLPLAGPAATPHRATTLDRGLADDLDLRLGSADQSGAFATVVGTLPSTWWEDNAATTVATRSADGWWANTYVPGDATMRLLQQRLALATDTALPGAHLGALALAETATPTDPIVSAPTDSALALGVHADTTAVEGAQRVRLEVAIRAVERAAGRRSPLRVAVVVDGRTALTSEAQSRIRGVLTALGRARSPRDRVAVYGAGPGGGELVALGTLAHGPVEVALRAFFGGAAVDSASTSLHDAIAEAAQAVAGEESVGLVLLLTPDGSTDSLVNGAIHAAALSSVTTSAIGLDASVPVDRLDAIALAGQGRRRVIAESADAARVVRGEVEAASRLVARAVRIRVRLAPGVSLVGVVGSRPLDELESTRTREAERAIDRELAGRLGIASDRDEDDDGVRILVPSFYAGTSHAVILDLLVSGPGAVAEVDVRYKDLVRLDNGRASGALSLSRGSARRGAAELRVVAAHLGHEVASALGEAGERASRGDASGAAERLLRARAAIDAARAEEPGLALHPSLSADAVLLDRYVAALRQASDRDLVATSLQYAARRRVVLPVSTLAAE